MIKNLILVCVLQWVWKSVQHGKSFLELQIFHEPSVWGPLIKDDTDGELMLF